MALGQQHEIHRRRFGRNLGIGLLLAGLVAIVFGLTVVKVTRGDPMQAFDHVARPEMMPQPGTTGGKP
ncbi:MAG: hypothetical protein ACRCSU_14805 [Paracoccaceae bacterium]